MIEETPFFPITIFDHEMEETNNIALIDLILLHKVS